MDSDGFRQGQLDGVGNVGNYRLEGHVVISYGVISVPGNGEADIAEVKFYGLRSESRREFNRAFIERVKERISLEFRTGTINPHIGLGWAVVSPGFLNVRMWGTEQDGPNVPFPTLYTFRKAFNETLAKRSAENYGDLCVFEQRIGEHERKAWEAYLNTKHSEANKGAYLNAMCAGYPGRRWEDIGLM